MDRYDRISVAFTTDGTGVAAPVFPSQVGVLMNAECTFGTLTAGANMTVKNVSAIDLLQSTMLAMAASTRKGIDNFGVQMVNGAITVDITAGGANKTGTAILCFKR